MKKDVTLVIMAAGMGSRFGGLKQIEPFGPNDEFIIDYSVKDAIVAGFTKIVFIIKRENYDLFKETIGKRVEPHIQVEYVFQEGNIPLGCDVPSERVKPLGTGHAILCCKDVVKEPFAVINSDDFYGRDAYMKAYEFLSQLSISDNTYGMIGYEVANTITDSGSVKRGVCSADFGKLTSLIESKVEKVGDRIVASPLSGGEAFDIQKDTIVSMNFLLFTPTLFTYLEELFIAFFEENKNTMETCEYLIPDVLETLIMQKRVTVDVIRTSATWYGVTYKEDTDGVKKALKEMTDQGEYTNPLWN